MVGWYEPGGAFSQIVASSPTPAIYHCVACNRKTRIPHEHFESLTASRDILAEYTEDRAFYFLFLEDASAATLNANRSSLELIEMYETRACREVIKMEDDTQEKVTQEFEAIRRQYLNQGGPDEASPPCSACGR